MHSLHFGLLLLADNYTIPEEWYTNGSSVTNNTLQMFPNFEDKPYIFDRKDVRIIFLVLYTIVFCSCFFGKLFLPSAKLINVI